MKKSFYVKNGQYKIYGQEQVIKNDPFYGDYYIDEEKYRSLHSCSVEAGDILISLVGTVGKILLLPDGCQPGIINPRLLRISPSKKFVFGSYLKNYLEWERTINVLLRQAQGGTMGVLNAANLKKLAVPIPPLPEQRKIAKILQTWDSAIATTENLIDASKQQKKALMQQLLTGKKRFARFEREGFKKTIHGPIPNDWKYLALSAIADHYSEKNTLDKKYPVVSCSKHVGFVDSLQYFKKKVYSEDLRGYKLIPKGCFGFPSNHIEEGSIGRQNQHEVGLVSPIYTVFKVKEEMVDSKFLISVLKTDQYRQIFSAATNSSVDRRGSLRWKEFGLIKIALPSIEEQQQISSSLSAADKGAIVNSGV